MKILIIGGAGFIGFHLTKYLLQKGYEVIGIDEDPEIVTEIKEQDVIPVVEEKPQPVVEQITKPTINEMPSPVVELPEESDIDDEDDDIEQIKSKILKTLSKIEQAEVD